jgi:hypothetical protein
VLGGHLGLGRQGAPSSVPGPDLDPVAGRSLLERTYGTALSQHTVSSTMGLLRCGAPLWNTFVQVEKDARGVKEICDER